MAAAVKLTMAEGLALVAALEAGVGTVPLAGALVSVLGPEKAVGLIVERKGVRLSKDEVLALVRAIYPLIPGTDLRSRLLWVVKSARAAIGNDVRFNAIVAYVVERLEAYAAGSGTPADPEAPAVWKLQPWGSGTIPIYVKTLYWWEDRDILNKDLAACARARVGYGFEMGGDTARKILLNPALLDKIEEAYAYALDYARSHGIWIYAIGPNDNMGEGKYGDPKIPLSKCMDGARRLCAIVRKYGPSNVIFTPVAETKTDAGREFEKYCAKELSGFILAYNGGGGHPDDNPSWSKCQVQHPCKLSQTYPAGTGVTNDCYTAILQMQGADNKPLNTGTNAKWMADGAARKYKFIGPYVFKFKGHDAAGIASCSLSTSGGEVDNTPVNGDDIDMSKAVWIGPSGKNAKVVGSLKVDKVDSKTVYYTLSKDTEAWEPHEGSKQCNQYCCAFFIRNGVPTGGKFDWSTYSRKTRPLENIRSGYITGVKPVAGEKWYLTFTDLNGTTRVPCKLAGVWK